MNFNELADIYLSQLTQNTRLQQQQQKKKLTNLNTQLPRAL